MKKRILGLTLLGAAVFGLLGALEYRSQLATPGSRVRLRADQRARERVADWPGVTLRAAEMMIEKYGPPDYVSDYSTEWKRRGPWKRIVIRRRAVEAPIEHVIDYEVPAFRFNDVAWFGHGLSLNETAGELSAAGGSEGLNCLALNMGHELAGQQRTLEEAGEFYTMTAALAERGKSSPYMERLLFSPQRSPESLMSW